MSRQRDAGGMSGILPAWVSVAETYRRYSVDVFPAVTATRIPDRAALRLAALARMGIDDAEVPRGERGGRCGRPGSWGRSRTVTAIGGGGVAGGPGRG